MCGIFGCIGNNAYNTTIEGLKRLQYRGYDSCGIAYFDNGFTIEKAIGTLDNLPKILKQTNLAFGHTRWATNGVVNIANAHPHVSYDKHIYVVHNGIIKNAEDIKRQLTKSGVDFYSDTDTEVIANFIAFNATLVGIEQALKSLFTELEGSFSLIVATSNAELYLIKKFSPLNLLRTNENILISSDIASLNDGKLYSLVDNDIIKIANGQITSLNKETINFTNHKNNLKSLDLNNFTHFMKKEIFEIPKSIESTYYAIKELPIDDILKGFNKLTLIGCGTAYHSCLIGEYWLKNEFKYDINTYLASNYDIKEQITPNHLHIIVSQSGETADCIKVANNIKAQGGKILVITNEKTSTIAKMADYHIFTSAEKEIAVASTKTYCCQVFVFAYLVNKMKNHEFDVNIIDIKQHLENYIRNINITPIAEQLKHIDKMIMIAKGIDYTTILEASLKIREIDYVYTLPMYGGELKHGTLSLVDENSYSLCLDTSKEDNQLQNAINEIRSRKGKIIDFSSFVPLELDNYLKPIYAIIPFHLLSYEIAVLNGRNPDMPRNLAKSVTVE